MAVDSVLLARLRDLRTIDITTYGRRSGKPRRIEIWWFDVDGRFIITGTPGPRDWLANVRANGAMLVHALGADLAAQGQEILDSQLRMQVFSSPDTRWYRTQSELDRLVAKAPMIEVVFD